MVFLYTSNEIIVNNDVVVRDVFYKYLHPKEVFISNGIVFTFMAKELKLKTKKSGDDNFDEDDYDEEDRDFDKSGLDFVYPYGCTLNVKKPAIPLLTTGNISFPRNRPICAVYNNVLK